MDELAERAALVALLRTRGKRKPGWGAVMAEVLEAGSAVRLLDEPEDGALIGDPAAHAALPEARQDVETWAAAGLQMVTVLDKSYPERLLGIHQAPPFLFYAGDLRVNDDGVSVVGSRKASGEGVRMATEVARALAEEGLTVIAGLAEGIDTAAHTAALSASGRTVAVIGTGITKVYPAENRQLQNTIAECGLVISQFYPDAPPRAQHFPMRNVTMSGYGLATVVIEASEHSGTRIQARCAVEHGRPVILSDLVVGQTEWGRALLGRPGVHTAASADEVLKIVGSIIEQQHDDIDLSQLALV